MLTTGRPQKFGYSGFFSAGLTVLGVLLLLQARSENFTHGAELAWAYAYVSPLIIGLVALVVGGIHLLRGRIRSVAAWLPVVSSVALVAWLIACIYFDAFRSA
jgi:hypothetical protein